jgi:cyclomaltodextrinase / maltogenic alpha-amylase / neopullulanase
VNTFPPGAFRMTFTDNHDKNSWNGTPVTNFGEGLQAAMVLAATIKGMPMIYSGQEAGLDRSLSFFEKDQIEWKEHPNAEFFKTLIALKKRNHALWNGHWGGEMIRLTSNCTNEVISFVREKNGYRIIVLINFSGGSLSVALDLKHYQGKYEDIFSKETVILDEYPVISLKAWGFRILEFR